MRCSFFEEGENEEHLFSVEDMDAPVVGDHVWINGGLGRSGSALPDHLRKHVRMVVVRRSFSIMFGGPYNVSAHCEVLLRVDDEAGG